MQDAWFLLAGAAFLVAASWISELVIGGGHKELALSSDEKAALMRAELTLRSLVEDGLPRLGRLEVLQRILWIWKSARVVALRSGRLGTVPLLAAFAGICLVTGCKNLVVPRSSDLRYVLGFREFFTYFVMPRKR